MCHMFHLSLFEIGHVDFSYLTWPAKNFCPKFFVTLSANMAQKLNSQRSQVAQTAKNELK